MMRAVNNTLFILGLMLMMSACSTDSPTNIEPVLSTLDATDITRTSAVVHGSVALSGSSAKPRLYFRYGEDNNLNLSVSADGDIKAEVKGLKAGTTYYYQLCGSGARAELQGGIKSFTTLPNNKPTLDGASVLSQGPVSAIIGFVTPDNGGAEITSAGCLVAEGRQFKATLKGDQWLTLITGLQTGCNYTIIPYASNDIGTTFGSALTLTTSNAMILTQAGDFASLMNNAGPLSSLTIAGPMNGEDLSCLRQLILRSSAISLDMTDVEIVSGGTYYESYHADDNVIGQYLFYGCTSLTDIKLPDDVVRIEKDAFKGCTHLKELTIPSKASVVVPSSDCSHLASIKVSVANHSFKSIDGVLLSADGSEIVWFPMGKTGSYTLPKTITTLGDYAFSHCSITSFVLPETLTGLGQGVFYSSKVESVTMPDGLQVVPTATFQQCKSLRKVWLGKGTALISDYVFDGCPLTDLHVKAETPPVVSQHSFATTGIDFMKTCRLYVLKGSARLYKATKVWKGFNNIVEE